MLHLFTLGLCLQIFLGNSYTTNSTAVGFMIRDIIEMDDIDRTY